MRLPAWTAGAAGVLYAGALAAFAVRQGQRAVRGEPLSWGKIGIVASTAATWYVGIVAFNSDFAFTVTNVVAHGLPYLALVWLYGRRKWIAPTSWRTWLYRPALLWVFVGVTILLAYLEEGAWDLLVWREHASLFGGWRLPTLPDEMLAVIVPALILPQATHYVLDAWIWKFDGSNPGLREFLFHGGRRFSWGPRHGPQAPRRSERPGGAVTLLWATERLGGATVRQTCATQRQAVLIALSGSLVALDVGDEPAGGAEEAGVGVAGADELDAEW